MNVNGIMLTVMVFVLLASGGTLAADRSIAFAISTDQHYGNAAWADNNAKVVQSIGTLPSTWVAPAGLRGVVCLGDLADTGTSAQWNQYGGMYDLFSNGGQMPCPVYGGYGNHDYNSWSSLGFNPNVWPMLAEGNARLPGVRLSPNNLCYSWDWQDVHFIQLNLYPGIAAVCNQSYTFLTNDLATCVGNSGRPVVLFHHYGFDATTLASYWPAGAVDLYAQAVRNYNIAAIFRGHGHGAALENFGTIPAYGIPSAGQYGQFAAVTIENTNLKVRIVDAISSNVVKWTWNHAIGPPASPTLRTGVREAGYQSVSVTGSCNFVVTSINWTNSLDGSTGSVAPAADWVANEIPLQSGDNQLVFTSTSRDGDVLSSTVAVAGEDTVHRAFNWFSVSDTHFNPPPFEGRKDVSANNTAVIDSINTLAGAAYPYPEWGIVQVPRGITHTGDCTDKGKPDEWDAFVAAYGVNGEGQVHYPVYEGYGNHDSYLSAYDPEKIAKRNLLRHEVWISPDGYHYSWDWDDVHFVQLNIYPGNTPLYCRNSLDFLRDDLEQRVGRSGRPVVILQHFGFDSYSAGYWSAAERDALYGVISNYNVVAFVHGHNHNIGIESFHGIPSFSVPSSGYEGMLAAFQASDNNLRVGYYDALNTNWSGITISIPIPPPQTPELQIGIEGIEDIDSVSLTGSCNFAVQQLEWTNLTSGASGIVPGSAEWTIPDVSLTAGINHIRIAGRNAGRIMAYGYQTVAAQGTASFHLTGGSADSRQIAWNAWSGVDEYFVDIATNSAFDPSGYFLPGFQHRSVSVAEASPSGLAAGVCYYVRVSAVDPDSGALLTMGSSRIMIAAGGYPGTHPEFWLQVGVQNGQQYVRFTPTPGFAYRLERSANLLSNVWKSTGGQDWIPYADEGAGITVLLDDNVFPAFYRVRAYDRSPGAGSGFRLRADVNRGWNCVRFLQSPAYSYTLECCTNLTSGIWFVPEGFDHLLCTDDGAEMTLIIDNDAFPAFYRIGASSF